MGKKLKDLKITLVKNIATYVLWSIDFLYTVYDSS